MLTNGSIYIEMAQLTAGPAVPARARRRARRRRRRAASTAATPFKQGLAGTFSDAHPPSDEELDAQWQFASFGDGHTLLPRTIRYIEDRRAEQDRFTGAIERHPSPLGVVWGERDPVAVYDMTARLLAARPDAPLITLDGVGHYPMIEDARRVRDRRSRLSPDPLAHLHVPCRAMRFTAEHPFPAPARSRARH